MQEFGISGFGARVRRLGGASWSGSIYLLRTPTRTELYLPSTSRQGLPALGVPRDPNSPMYYPSSEESTGKANGKWMDARSFYRGV